MKVIERRKCRLCETFHTQIRAQFQLPIEVDDAGARARLDKGILMLTLPKKESAQPKKLTIQ